MYKNRGGVKKTEVPKFSGWELFPPVTDEFNKHGKGAKKESHYFSRENVCLAVQIGISQHIFLMGMTHGNITTRSALCYGLSSRTGIAVASSQV